MVSRIAQEQQLSVAEVRALMRQWYNGYRFVGNTAAPTVYNPYSLLSFLDDRVLANYWFDTGTPSFALNLIRERAFRILDLEEGVTVPTSVLIGNVDATNMNITALLFQTGYLTISQHDAATDECTLRFPNREVRKSFFEHLAALFLDLSTDEAAWRMKSIAQGLRHGNVEPVILALNDMLGQLSHYLQRREEAFYHAILLTILINLGFDVDAEKSCCTGRMDLGLRYGNKAYIFELKRDQNAAEALRQIHDRQYARAYTGKGLELYLVGININSESCSVDDWQLERL